MLAAYRVSSRPNVKSLHGRAARFDAARQAGKRCDKKRRGGGGGGGGQGTSDTVTVRVTNEWFHLANTSSSLMWTRQWRGGTGVKGINCS